MVRPTLFLAFARRGGGGGAGRAGRGGRRLANRNSTPSSATAAAASSRRGTPQTPVLSTDTGRDTVAPTDPWEAVTVPPDPSTNEPGGIYYWNTKTNATTAIGEAKPTTSNNNNTTSLMQPPPQAGPMAAASNNNTSNSGGGGLMDVVKEGMAFGVGSGTFSILFRLYNKSRRTQMQDR